MKLAVPSPLLKLVGAVMLAAGMLGAALAAWLIELRLPATRGDASGSISLTALLVAICAFCSLVGYRLLFNRPNRFGSLFSPFAWRLFAGFFCLMGVLMTIPSLRRGEYGALVILPCFGALGYACLLASRRARINAIPTVILPPETSLMALDGFMPAGFECGVEMLNDNLTPMEFVVSALRDKLGLPEQAAIRSMLEIHMKGGVLLPTSTPEEAARIADAVTAEARALNHPLVCRAVSTENSR
jgi:ATP-dependent Clp protease adapter protein ClpS